MGDRYTGITKPVFKRDIQTLKYAPYPYQSFAEAHILENEAAGLFLGMGLGKTVTTMTAADKLLNDSFEVSKVLVIAPKKVAEEVWTTEASKWDHLRHLRISKILGSEAQRKAALKAKADIYVINRENVVWLIGHYGTAFPFDMIVIDESSSFKDANSKRFKQLRQIMPKVRRRVILTGTPTPNSLLEIWPQMYLLDQGERLGKTLTEFRGKYFTKDPYKAFAKYEVRKEDDELIGEGYYEKKIYNKISDVCISMKAEDYLQLPPRLDQITRVHLPDKVMDAYLDFEKKQVLALEDEEDISAVNAAVLSGKLLQFASGAVYREDKTYYETHGEKLTALEERIEAANGEPVLVTYWFKHELERIMRALKRFKPIAFDTSALIKDWNAGKIPVLLGHPASMGHGLNLQYGGHLIEHYSNIWSSELYQQVITRIDRQGQTMPVGNNHLVAVGTIEEDVLKAREDKINGQDALMRAVKARIDRYRK